MTLVPPDSEQVIPIPAWPASAEESRLRALNELDLMDTEAEEEYDELVQLAAAICGTPMSLMTLLDDRRQWFKAAMGLEEKETPREVAFCAHAIQQPDLFVVEDAQQDERFAQNPLVTGSPKIKFYAGMPLTTRDGFALGTLCVLDRVPRHLNEQQRHALEVLARQVNARIELRARQKADAAASAKMAEYQRQLEVANARLTNMVMTDELTGLKNRRAFEERLAFEFSMAKRKRRDLSVVMLDADNFKAVNDRYGHPAGDAVLRHLGKALSDTIRETDLAARIGGEEFAVLLPETDERGAVRWCRRLQRAIAASAWEHVAVTVSIGVASRGALTLSGTDVVALADRALYEAKSQGKDRIVGAETDTSVTGPLGQESWVGSVA